MRPPEDLLALGAACLPDAALIDVLTRGRLDDAERKALSDALSLSPDARAAALHQLSAGPVVLAALELGRRAALFPSPAKRRVAGPSDIAAVARPHLAGERERLCVIALDLRLSVARIRVASDGLPGAVETSRAEVLATVLGAGCRRFALAHRHLVGPARPSQADIDSTLDLAGAARAVDVSLVDHVVLGDDGLHSFSRNGLLPVADPRYR